MQRVIRLLKSLLWVGGTAIAIGLLPRSVLSQPPLTPMLAEAIPAEVIPTDNIYHENDNLPDDADIFPRLGKIAGLNTAQTNCRVAPWGRVVTRVPGTSLIEIDRRLVDRNGDSWFHNGYSDCWIHQSRIDLL